VQTHQISFVLKDMWRKWKRLLFRVYFSKVT